MIHGTTRSIIQNIASEFKSGKHQNDIKDLVWEIQFRLGCSYGRALSYANDIRVGKVRGQ